MTRTNATGRSQGAAKHVREVPNAVTLYHGLTHIGEVVEIRCGQFEAVDAKGVIVGTYAGARAAMDAVLNQAHK